LRRRHHIVEVAWNYFRADTLVTGGESVQRQS
jgi:hypothetical protein